MGWGAGTRLFSNPSAAAQITIGEARFSEPRQVTCLEEGSRFGLERVTISDDPLTDQVVSPRPAHGRSQVERRGPKGQPNPATLDGPRSLCFSDRP